MLKEFVRYALVAPFKYVVNDFKEYVLIRKDVKRLKNARDLARSDISRPCSSEQDVDSCIRIKVMCIENGENPESWIRYNEIKYCPCFDNTVCDKTDCKYFNKNVDYHILNNRWQNAVRAKRNFWANKNEHLR